MGRTQGLRSEPNGTRPSLSHLCELGKSLSLLRFSPPLYKKEDGATVWNYHRMKWGYVRRALSMVFGTQEAFRKQLLVVSLQSQ